MSKWFCNNASNKECGFKGFWTEREKKCEVCGFAGSVDIHHIVPISDGGAHSDANVALLCPNHHRLVTLGKLEMKRPGERRYTKTEIQEAASLFVTFTGLEMGTLASLEAYLRYLEFVQDKAIDRIDVIGFMTGTGRRNIYRYLARSPSSVDIPDMFPRKDQLLSEFLTRAKAMLNERKT